MFETAAAVDGKSRMQLWGFIGIGRLDLTYHPNAKSMVRVCDVVRSTLHCTRGPEHLFNDALIGKMKRGALTNHWLRRCHRFHSPEIAAGFRGS